MMNAKFWVTGDNSPNQVKPGHLLIYFFLDFAAIAIAVVEKNAECKCI